MGELVVSERQLMNTLEVLKGFLKGALACSGAQDRVVGIGEVNAVAQGVLRALPSSSYSASVSTSAGIQMVDVGGISSLSGEHDPLFHHAVDMADSGLNVANITFRDVFCVQGDLDAKALVALHHEIRGGWIHDLEMMRKLIDDALVPVVRDWADAKKVALTLDDTIEAAKIRSFIPPEQHFYVI